MKLSRVASSSRRSFRNPFNSLGSPADVQSQFSSDRSPLLPIVLGDFGSVEEGRVGEGDDAEVAKVRSPAAQQSDYENQTEKHLGVFVRRGGWARAAESGRGGGQQLPEGDLWPRPHLLHHP